MKDCIACGSTKPEVEFYKHSQMKDGRLNKCKDCCRGASRKNRAKKIEYYRAYDAARGSRRTSEDAKQYRENNPIKYAATIMVGNAVRDGKMSKPDHCQECGTSGHIHGHHDDYAEPLKVRWLCASCHHQWHAIHGEGKNG